MALSGVRRAAVGLDLFASRRARAHVDDRRFQMRRRLLASIGAVAAAIAVASMTATPVAGQAPAAAKARTAAPAKAYTPPRTADGHPDLQGVWDFRNVIPLERPSQFAGKEFLTDQEVAEY